MRALTQNDKHISTQEQINNISHKLRTPLSAIICCAEDLHCYAKKQKPYLTLIQKASDELDINIKQLIQELSEKWILKP